MNKLKNYLTTKTLRREIGIRKSEVRIQKKRSLFLTPVF